VAFNVKLKNNMDHVGNLANYWLGCRAGFRGPHKIQLIRGPTK